MLQTLDSSNSAIAAAATPASRLSPQTHPQCLASHTRKLLLAHTTASSSSSMDSSSPARLLRQLHTLLLGADSDTDDGQSMEPQLQGAGQQQLLEQLIQVGNPQ
jgi:hypothetical protein